MSLMVLSEVADAGSFPRASGDEPAPTGVVQSGVLFSPRERG